MTKRKKKSELKSINILLEMEIAIVKKQYSISVTVHFIARR